MFSDSVGCFMLRLLAALYTNCAVNFIFYVHALLAGCIDQYVSIRLFAEQFVSLARCTQQRLVTGL